MNKLLKYLHVRLEWEWNQGKEIERLESQMYLFIHGAQILFNLAKAF